MPTLVFGIVTNCFQRQLEDGEPLIDLIAEADRRGFRAIELRHGSLGEFATPDGLPDAARLSALPGRFPGLRFNIAIPVPFLRQPIDSHAALISAGRWGADAVAGENPPHLRLVDLKTTDSELAAMPPDDAAQHLLPLVSAMTQLDGILSVENGPQRWDLFQPVFQAARGVLGPEGERLKLCYDPCNLCVTADRPAPDAVTASLSANDLSMVHCKQRRGGLLLPGVAEGDVDWRNQRSLLDAMRYHGPLLFEVAPSSALWSELDAARDFLNGECGDAE